MTILDCPSLLSIQVCCCHIDTDAINRVTCIHGRIIMIESVMFSPSPSPVVSNNSENDDDVIMEMKSDMTKDKPSNHNNVNSVIQTKCMLRDTVFFDTSLFDSIYDW